MEKKEIDHIYHIISEVINVPIDQINDDSSPDTIEDWDSFQHMNLILAIEEYFKIEFTDEEIIEMISVGKIIDGVKKKKN